MKKDIIKQLRQHTETLLERYKLEHVEVSDEDPAEFKGSFVDRRVFYPVINDDLKYLIALHEIGHFAIVCRRGVVLDELSVWIWCREVALIWPLEFDQLVAGCIESYCENINKSDRVNEITKVVMRS